MTNVAELDDQDLRWWCPGCEVTHEVPVNQQGGWEWNGSLERPTLTPSVKVESHRQLINTELQEPALTNENNIRMTPLCHIYMHDGHIQFLSDCTHHLGGQTVPMAPLAERS